MRDPIWAIMDDEGRRISWLAQRAGYTRVYLSYVKAGKRHGSARFRARCAAALGRSVAELFADAKEVTA